MSEMRITIAILLILAAAIVLMWPRKKPYRVTDIDMQKAIERASHWKNFKFTDCKYLIGPNGEKLEIDHTNHILRGEDGKNYVIDPEFLK